MITWLVDSDPIRIYGQGSVEANDNVTITYEDGTVATIFLSQCCGYCYPKKSVEIFTGNSTIVMDMFFEIRADLSRGRERFVTKRFPAKWDEVAEVPGVTGQDGGMDLYYKKIAFLRNDKLCHERHLQPDKGHYAFLDYYADGLLNNRPAPCDEIDGVRATVMALKAMESIRRNQPVEIAPDDYCLPLRRTKYGGIR